MTLNKRTEYGDHEIGQAAKSLALKKASGFVQEIIQAISPLLKECVYFESEKTLGQAPALELPDGRLVIAPDIKCTTSSGKVFWIEVKDKSQRFFKPDTGADLFQVYGWYRVFESMHEPVFVIFRDPEFEQCLPRNKVSDGLKQEFKKRWEMFKGYPYGGWLSQLLKEDHGYPQIFKERTREIPMYIFYFLVFNMTTNIRWEDVIDQVNNQNIPTVPVELKAFYEGKLIDQKRIETMIAELVSGKISK